MLVETADRNSDNSDFVLNFHRDFTSTGGRKGADGVLTRLLAAQMLNAWPKIIMCRRSRDGNPCLKDQLEDLNHVGKMAFWKI